jgi:hypothetical protein
MPHGDDFAVTRYSPGGTSAIVNAPPGWPQLTLVSSATFGSISVSEMRA